MIDISAHKKLDDALAALGRLEAAVRELDEGKPIDGMEEALRLLSEDMHPASSRPCATCNFATRAFGKPFGCVAFAEKRKGST